MGAEWALTGPGSGLARTAWYPIFTVTVGKAITMYGWIRNITYMRPGHLVIDHLSNHMPVGL